MAPTVSIVLPAGVGAQRLMVDDTQRNPMTESSITGGTPAPAQPAGRDIDALGPSDSTDSGSDVQTDRNRAALPDEASEGAIPVQHGSDTDASGTGERASADPTEVASDADILPDRLGELASSEPDDEEEES